MIVLVLLLSAFFITSCCQRSWRDQHPQQRQLAYASRLSCYSCMSPYLEHQYMYISHLYRRPLGFTEKCDQA
ncbi:hypothetical protein Tcan_00710, partial [Toxocara canis]